MNRECFLEMLFWAMKPGENGLTFGDEISDSKRDLRQTLDQMENTPSQCTGATIAEFRQKLETAFVQTEKGYYIAGMQISARYFMSMLDLDF